MDRQPLGLAQLRQKLANLGSVVGDDRLQLPPGPTRIIPHGFDLFQRRPHGGLFLRILGSRSLQSVQAPLLRQQVLPDPAHDRGAQERLAPFTFGRVGGIALEAKPGFGIDERPRVESNGRVG